MKQKQTTPAEETEDKRPNETPDGESSDGETSDGESSDGLKEAGESMLSHLMALRKVLLISAAAVLIGFVLVFYLAIDPLMAQILAPIQARGIQVIFTTMSEALVTKFKVALLAGMSSGRFGGSSNPRCTRRRSGSSACCSCWRCCCS